MDPGSHEAAPATLPKEVKGSSCKVKPAASLPAHASFQRARPQPLAPLGFDTRVTFASWTGRLLRSVLRSRATFAGFLCSTLHLPRLPPDRPYVRSGNLFPLPPLLPQALMPSLRRPGRATSVRSEATTARARMTCGHFCSLLTPLWFASPPLLRGTSSES